LFEPTALDAEGIIALATAALSVAALTIRLAEGRESDALRDADGRANR
jgi:hypothetical protein